MIPAHSFARLYEVAAPLAEASERRRYYENKYELQRLLGRGGMGEVWLAVDTWGQNRVALKLLAPDRLDDYESRQRFEDEAFAATKLVHPNIVRILEIHSTYLAMQFVEGESLATFDRGDVPRLVRHLRDAAMAVHYAHQQGVIHRDLKPANLIVSTPEDRIYVTDFGLARRTTVRQRLPEAGRVLGTPAYMPPEQAGGRSGEVDARSDVYSLGATLYELLAGHPPFVGDDLADVLARIQVDAPAPLEPLGVDPALAAIVARCLAKEPDERFPSAYALAGALNEWWQR